MSTGHSAINHQTSHYSKSNAEEMNTEYMCVQPFLPPVCLFVFFFISHRHHRAEAKTSHAEPAGPAAA